MGFKESITASLEASIEVFGKMGTSESTEFSSTFDYSFGTTVETSKTLETTTVFTAPAGKDYTVYQYVANFEDAFGLDSFTYSGDYKIEEF